MQQLRDPRGEGRIEQNYRHVEHAKSNMREWLGASFVDSCIADFFTQ